VNRAKISIMLHGKTFCLGYEKISEGFSIEIQVLNEWHRQINFLRSFQSKDVEAREKGFSENL
jgi:hypothetical protein